MYAEVKNFKSEIGCVIVFKMLIYRKIRGYLEMTNEGHSVNSIKLAN